MGIDEKIINAKKTDWLTKGLSEDEIKNLVEIAQEYVEYEHRLKADYENRLKADLKAILVELQLEIEEIKPLEPTDDEDWQYGCFHGLELMQDKCLKLIQQKIDKLKEAKDGENNN